MKEKLYAKEILKHITTENLDLSKLIAELFVAEYQESKKEAANKIAANQSLVNKYFKTMADPDFSIFPSCQRYFKVISAHSEGPNCVECLIFDEYPSYYFEADQRQDQEGCGFFHFNSFRTESRLSSTIKTYKEITSDEYWLAAKKYLNYLSIIDWPHNHSKDKMIWPHEPGWKA